MIKFADMRIRAASLLDKAESLIAPFYSRILVVDDNESTLDLLKMILENFFTHTKIDAVIAQNEEVAVKEASDAKVKMALVDYYLAEGDSKKLCKRLKKMGIPVCIMTGDNENESIIKFCKEHELPLLKKPFSIPILHRAVDKCIAKKIA